VADIAGTPVTVLERALGRATAAHLSALASGRDERRVSPRVAEKSIGAEETFAHDIGDSDVIRRELLRLAGRTARGLRSSGYAARTVVVKLRLASFKTITRSRTLADPTDVAQQIYLTACDLYEAAGLDPRALLRLVGVRATGLVPVGTASTQLAFGERPAAWREAEQALDRIAGRFGTDTVRPATLVDSGRQEHGPGRDSGGDG
jgi:DNA polymerase-4